MKNNLRRRYLAMALTAILIFTQIFGNGSLLVRAEEDSDIGIVTEEPAGNPQYLAAEITAIDPGVHNVCITAKFASDIAGENAIDDAWSYATAGAIYLVTSTTAGIDTAVDVLGAATENGAYTYHSVTEHYVMANDTASYLFPAFGTEMAENTTYYYRLAYRNGDDYVYLTAESSFSTLPDSTIPDSEFKDPVFLSYIKDNFDTNHDNSIQLSEIESRTGIESNGDYNSISYIKDITGIQYFKNLNAINLNGNNIRDLGPIADLKYLKAINVAANDITEFPDLSGKVCLDGFNMSYNVIAADSITAAKLPAQFLAEPAAVISEVAGHQRDFAGVTPIFARNNTYYRYTNYDNQVPLWVKFYGLKGGDYRSYELSVLKNGEPSGYGPIYRGDGIFAWNAYAEEISDTPVAITFELTDNTGSVLWSGTRNLIFTNDVDTLAYQTVNLQKFFENDTPCISFANAETRGMSITGDWHNAFLNIPNDVEDAFDETNANRIPAKMVGEDGEEHVVALVGDGTSAAATIYENRYEDICDTNDGTLSTTFFDEGTVTRTAIRNSNFSVYGLDSEWFVAGDYTLMIAQPGGEEYTPIATITATEGNVVNHLYVYSDNNNVYRYDNSKDYVYVAALGNISNPRSYYPVLYLEDTAVTEFKADEPDACFNDHYGIIYKLKKSGEVWDTAHIFSVSFNELTAINGSNELFYDPYQQGYGPYAASLTIEGNAERTVKPDTTETLVAKHTDTVEEPEYSQIPVWTSSDTSVITVTNIDIKGEYPEDYDFNATSVKAVGEGTAYVIVTYGGRTAWVKYTVSNEIPAPDPTPEPTPDPNNNENNESNNQNQEEVLPTPAPDAPLHSISVVEGATAKNSAGKEVKSAKENETISISWTAKADYDFVKWNLEGAVPKEPVSANTIFVMGKEDVIVSYDEKLKVDSQVLESLPADADRSAKVNSLKFDSKKLTMQKGSKKEYKVNVKTADGATPKTYYVTKNKQIVAVDENGNFYATGIGETEVTAYCGNRSATVKVSVVCYTEKISILDTAANDVTEGTIELKGGEKEFLTVSFDPYDSTDNRNVSWKSDNTKAVKISKGIITAKEVKQEETAKITATYKVTAADGSMKKKTATVTVKVKPVEVSKDTSGDTAHKLTLSKKSLTVKYSEKDKKAVELVANIQAKSGDFAAVKIEAESTNNDVVSVNKISDITGEGKKGKATISLDPKSAGIAYIIVKTTAADGKTNVNRCKITINTPITDIVIKSGTLKVDSSLKMELRKGTSGTIEAVVEPVGSTDKDKLKITGTGGVTVKNGVILAKKETAAGKPAKIKVKCGKITKIIEVTIK